MVYQETFVQRNGNRIYVRDYPGTEPTIILMHGFPDNMHLYDRLLPHLSPPRRVVAFDFSGDDTMRARTTLAPRRMLLRLRARVAWRTNMGRLLRAGTAEGEGGMLWRDPLSGG